MKIRITHEFSTSEATFWDKIFFDEEFNRALYIVKLGFPQWEVVSNEDKGTSVSRRVKVTPKQDAPAVVKKLVGDSFSYVEEGSFDKARKRYELRVVPSSMGEKLHVSGALWTESLGEKRVRRVAEMNVEVKIFGVGGVVEGFIGKSLEDSYAQAAAFTNKWIADKAL